MLAPRAPRLSLPSGVSVCGAAWNAAGARPCADAAPCDRRVRCVGASPIPRRGPMSPFHGPHRCRRCVSLESMASCRAWTARAARAATRSPRHLGGALHRLQQAHQRPPRRRLRRHLLHPLPSPHRLPYRSLESAIRPTRHVIRRTASPLPSRRRQRRRAPLNAVLTVLMTMACPRRARTGVGRVSALDRAPAPAT